VVQVADMHIGHCDLYAVAHTAMHCTAQPPAIKALNNSLLQCFPQSACKLPT
jgi:hypothetical protein